MSGVPESPESIHARVMVVIGRLCAGAAAAVFIGAAVKHLPEFTASMSQGLELLLGLFIVTGSGFITDVVMPVAVLWPWIVAITIAIVWARSWK